MSTSRYRDDSFVRRSAWLICCAQLALSAPGCEKSVSSGPDMLPGKTAEQQTAEPQPEPQFATKVERGAWLFQSKGCWGCHGEAGRGGVVNLNYLADTIPALNTLAERMMLFDKEDAQAVIAMIEQGRDPAAAQPGEPPFAGYPRFLAQYGAVRGVMTNGSKPGKKDPNGPEPPLPMPAWASQLDSDAMNAIIAYLLTLYDWEAP